MLKELNEHVRLMAGAERAAEVFRTLLTASRLAAPRAAVFLLRRDGSQGWGSVGYEALATRNQRAYTALPGQGWMGRLVASADSSSSRPAAAADPDFGQRPAAEAYGCVVRVKDKPIAVLVAERSVGEQPWHPEALDLLVAVGCLRLELDVARRKGESAAAQAREPREPISSATVLERAPAAAPPVSFPTTPATIRSAPMFETAPESEPRISGGVPAIPTTADGLDVVPTSAPAQDEQPNLQAAKRYARLVATDIRLYNEESVMQGRRQGDLLDRLGDQLDRGKETFLRRHGDLGPAGLAVLHEAYVQVLAGGDGKLLPTSCLD